jgi:glucokinase
MAAEIAMPAINTVTGAVDIGGTTIAVGAVDASGKVLAKREFPTRAQEGFDAAMGRVTAMLESVRRDVRADLSGIGIGCTGPVDPLTGVIGNVDFLPGWQGCNPVDHLAVQSGLTAAMENDADAAALAEFQWGAGRGRHSMICVTVGTGIGGGIVLNGTLYRGVGGAHPEIGHHVIDDSGPQCFCGARGCWESLAGGPAIASHALLHAPPDYPHREQLTASLVCDLARAGDASARREIAREGHYLGIGIANLITLYAPEVVVLTGGVMKSADLFLPAIQEVVRRNCGLVPAAQVAILPSALGEDAPLIGAGVVWRHRFERAASPC